MNDLNIAYDEPTPFSLSHDEDWINLYEFDNTYIRYVRNYRCQQEFIVVSEDLLQQLPEHMQPVVNVFVPTNFFALKKFKQMVQSYVVERGQAAHFRHLFNSTVAQFFDSL